MMISVVIPVFNDAVCLPAIIERTRLCLEEKSHQIEFIFVDDGSDDSTWQALKTIKKSTPEQAITLIRLEKNSGQQAATLCGLAHAKGDIHITMDADLQHPPESILMLVCLLKEKNLELAYGECRKGHNAHRQFFSALYRFFFSPLSNRSVTASSFRALEKALTDRLIMRPDLTLSSIDHALMALTQQLASIDIEHQPRTYGTSSYTTASLIILAIRQIFYSRDLSRALMVFAVIFSIFAVGMMLFSKTHSHATILMADVAAVFTGLSLTLSFRNKIIAKKSRYTVRELV